MAVLFLSFYYHMIFRVLLIYIVSLVYIVYIVVILMYVLTELGYVLICQVKEEEKNVVLKMFL